MLEMKNHFDVSGSIEIRKVDIVGVACTFSISQSQMKKSVFRISDQVRLKPACSATENC